MCIMDANTLPAVIPSTGEEQLAAAAAGARLFSTERPFDMPVMPAASPYSLMAQNPGLMAHRHLATASAASIKSDPNINISLENADLWQQFHDIGTEMIITKLGRRMFPTLKVNLSGLDANTKYFVLLDLVLADDSRFRFNAGWLRSGKAEPQWPSRVYTHPDSPATGAQWMKHEISFQKVKLTNNTMDQQGHLVLTSMHKYVPRVHVIAASDYASLQWGMPMTINTATFDVCSFIAVTAYANDRMTQLKIDNNPFAKGFRENGQLRVKKRQNAESANDCRKKSRPSSASSTHSSLNITDDESPASAPGALESRTPPPTTEPAAVSPTKCSSNFSIARLVGEASVPSCAGVLQRPDLVSQQALHHQHQQLGAHPWLAGHLLNPYSPMFAHRLAWPHLPALPMMHFTSMFPHGAQLMATAPGAAVLPSPPHKLF